MSAHAIIRARQRYDGLVITSDDLDRFAVDILAGRSVLVKRMDGGKEEHLVAHGKIVLSVGFWRGTGMISTVLPRDSAYRKTNGGSMKQKHGAGKNRFGGNRAKRSPRPQYEPEIDMDEVGV